MQILIALALGLLFGLGILVAGMGNPAKVLNFFDFAGTWDPNLAFVMGGALAVNMIGYRLILRRPKPMIGSFALPSSSSIDAALIGGSLLFGVGWGISGFCPGGLIPVLALGSWEPLIFFAGLVTGLLCVGALRRQLRRSGA